MKETLWKNGRARWGGSGAL